MLAVSAAASSNNTSNIYVDGRSNDITMESSFSLDDFPDFSIEAGNLLDSIDFDDLFTGISDEGDDMLPGLETDPHELLLAEFEDDNSMPSFNQQQEEELVVIGDGEEGNNNSNQEDDDEDDGSNLDVMMEYSVSGGGNDMNNSVDVSGSTTTDKVVESGGGDVVNSIGNNKDEEIESKKMESSRRRKSGGGKDGGGDRGSGKKWSSKSNNHTNSTTSKSSNSSNNSNKDQGKRKTKVDWTPDLHRRFVQAVEQLGVDKAVPSRILELMGIDCLTRHNIASHLQKYRSHRKHLLAREAEAARWTQKRQIYNGAVAPPPPPHPIQPPSQPPITNGKLPGHHPMYPHHNPWNSSPTMGFPPTLTRPPPMHHHHAPPPFLPLHVWGHPTHHMEAGHGNRQQQQPMMPIWPKHIVAAPPPPHGAAPWAKHLTPPPSAVPWQRVPNALPPACFPPSAAHHSFAAMPGVPQPTMYNNKSGSPPAAASPPNLNFHPTKESIDAAIGDVISKPWLPLPLGLKPPSVDSVLVELQRQGIPKIPPSSSASQT